MYFYLYIKLYIKYIYIICITHSLTGRISSENNPPKIISLVVVVGLVWSHDPKSYAGGSFSLWQVLPSQACQRVGSRQIDDRIAGSRARVVLAGSNNLWCILTENYWCSGENTAIVGRCCVHQLSNQQPKEEEDNIYIYIYIYSAFWNKIKFV